MDFPIQDLMDEQACYNKLLLLLHPNGLICPRCGAMDHLGVHRRHRAPVIDYQCGRCRRVFNCFTGTVLHGTRRCCSQLLLILRGAAQGVSTAQLARELQCDRSKLLALRHRLQAQAADALDRTMLADQVVECDEMYQNAGEKRPKTRRRKRPAASPRQQGSRTRHLETGSPAGLRNRRSRQFADSPGSHTRPYPKDTVPAGRTVQSAGRDGQHRRVGRV